MKRLATLAPALLDLDSPSAAFVSDRVLVLEAPSAAYPPPGTRGRP